MNPTSWIIPFSQRADRRVAHRLRHRLIDGHWLLCRDHYVNVELAERARKGDKRCRRCLEARDEL